MPHVRARIVVALAAALVAVGCAPGPSLGDADPIVTTTVAPTTTHPPTTTTTTPGGGIPQVAPQNLFPVAPEDLGPLARVDGRIAFHSADASIRSGMGTLDLDTGTLPGQPTWSRDGSRVAFVSLDGRQGRIDIFDGATGDTVSTAAIERLYFFLSWSHDGTRIAALGPGLNDNGEPQTVLDILSSDGTLLHESVATASSLFIAWDPAGLRIAAHADDRLIRIDADGTATDLGAVGINFFAPKWIPGTNEILLTTDVEGTSLVVRRSIDGFDTLRSVTEAPPELGLSVHPGGEVAAISYTFEVEGAGAGERIGLPILPQAPTVRSGLVEILDLATGERVEVFTGISFWVEWNPQGTHLLIYGVDLATGAGTWSVYEHRPGEDPLAATELVTFNPTPIFLSAYLIFADQFIESPRLWSPDGTAFVYAELTEDGSLIRSIGIEEGSTPATVGSGEVGFWSPPR